MQIVHIKSAMCSVKEKMMIIMYAFKIVLVAYLIVKQYALVIMLIFAAPNHYVTVLMEHSLHHHLVSN